MEVVIEGVILGTLSAAGFGLTYTRLPKAAQDFVKNHPLLSDVALTAATYHLLGGTLTALMAAGMVSVFVSMLLFMPKARSRLITWWQKFCALFRRRQPALALA
jgi:hypothetical protein